MMAPARVGRPTRPAHGRRKARRPRSWLQPLRSALLPAAAVAVIGYFAFHAVMGPSGLLAWKGYKHQRTELERQAASLTTDRRDLQHRADLLDPRGVDPDLADELVRRNLGVVRPDELVVPMPDAEAGPTERP